MDYLLKEKGEIDLKFTLYKVLATSNDDGFMEYVEESKTLQFVEIKKNGDIGEYIRNLGGDDVKK